MFISQKLIKLIQIVQNIVHPISTFPFKITCFLSNFTNKNVFMFHIFSLKPKMRGGNIYLIDQMGIERVVFDGIGIYLNILTISLIKFSFPTKMDLYLFNSVGYSKLYNCSGYNVTDIPIEKRQDVVWGILFIIMFVLYELLYLPCLYSIGKHLGQACYKFMFFIGIVDVICLPICALLHGYFAITGAVFCSHPDLIYVSGSFGLFFWVIESSGDIILAMNRCVELSSPIWGQRLYAGNRAWLWLIPPMIYGFYILFFTMPVLFSGLYFAWFFNPHVGYIDDFGSVYNNDFQNFHNWLVTFGLSASYFIFTGLFFYRAACGNNRTTLAQKMSFLQVLAISVVNIVCGLIYIYMQFFRISEFIIYLASFLWVTAHGLPSLIYLFMNKTIRNDFFAIFGYTRIVHQISQGKGPANSAKVGPTQMQAQNTTMPSITFH